MKNTILLLLMFTVSIATATITLPKIKLTKQTCHCKAADKAGICPHDYKKEYNESVKCLKEGQFNKALSLINSSIKKAEEQAEDTDKLYYQKAQALAAKKDYKGASEEINKDHTTEINSTQ